MVFSEIFCVLCGYILFMVKKKRSSEVCLALANELPNFGGIISGVRMTHQRVKIFKILSFWNESVHFNSHSKLL